MEKLSPGKNEVMLHLEKEVDALTDKFLIPVEKNWQPSDFLPDSRDYDSFVQEVKELREAANEMSYEVWVCLIADTLTEEALPTYESWIAALDGVNLGKDSGWGNWTRRWTSEENRHGDVLNKYLYLSGKVNMKKFEESLQYLLSDGIDIKTDNDPYRTFVYTTFQEIATNISHKRVGDLARDAGVAGLAKMSAFIAADEARHAKAYGAFVSRIFELDPNEMMLAYADMMKKKIVMPAHNMREVGVGVGETFVHFSNCAQKLNVYTSADYIKIMERLTKEWQIDKLTELDDEGKKARDYVMALPDRLRRVISRLHVPEVDYKFGWVA